MTALAGLLDGWLSWQLSGLWAITLVAPLLWLLDRHWGIRLGPHWLFAVWAVVFFRALLPVQVGSASLPAPDFQALTHAALGSGSGGDALSGWLLIICGIWLVGAASVAAMFARAHRRWRSWMISNSRIANADLTETMTRLASLISDKRLPELRVSDQLNGPLVTGVRRPIIVLPAALESLPEHADTKMMLAHELTHIRRRDPLIQVIALGVCCLFWMHPLIWVARRRLQSAQEGWCDRQTIALTAIDTAAYRHLLVQQLARSEGMSPAESTTAIALGMSASFVLRRALQLGQFGKPGLKLIRQTIASAMMATLLACSTIIATTDPVEWMAQQNPDDLPGSIAKRYAVMAQMSELARTVSEEPVAIARE